MSVTESPLSSLLAQTNFGRALGMRIVRLGAGTCTLHVPLLETSRRPGGVMAGYVLVAVADVATWLAMKTLLGPDDPSVTVDLHTVFVRAARTGVDCDATLLRCGKRLVSATATCRDERGELVAQHTLTYARVEGPATKALSGR